MRILLFGKNGQLGWELQRTLPPLGEVLAFDAQELDLTQITKLAKLIRETKPHLIVNASAYTAVDRAESEPKLAMTVNAKAPAVMAEEALKLKVPFVHYSTDYVFDGRKKTAYVEDDLTNPLNVYGQSKLVGEQAIGHVGGAYIILRTSWVYSLRGDGFVSKVLSWSRQQEEMKVVSDQIGSPTWARMLAEVTSAMLAGALSSPFSYFEEKSGVYHLGGSGSVSRLDFARAILRFDPKADEQIVRRLEPALTSDFPTPATRPLTAALNCSRFERVFKVGLSDWQNGLRLAMESNK